MDPIELLNTLQSIETGMGRHKTIDKGPRVIDLDILLYGKERHAHERLHIPHKLMLEREFVLRPLCQYGHLGTIYDEHVLIKLKTDTLRTISIDGAGFVVHFALGIPPSIRTGSSCYNSHLYITPSTEALGS